MSDRYVKPFCLLVAFLLTWALGAVAFGQKPCDIRIVTHEHDGGSGYGSGTFITTGENGSWVLTAHHVIRDASVVSVVDQDGQQHRTNLIYQCPDRDAAILFTPIPNQRYREVRPGPIGDEAVWVSGWPGMGQEFRAIVTKATPSSFLDGQRAFWGESYQGQSGGGILDAEGRIVGVVSASDERETVGLAGEGLYRFYQEACQKTGYYIDNCPNGQCSRFQSGQRIIQVQPQITRPQVVSPPVVSKPPAAKCDCKESLATLGNLIAQLAENQKTQRNAAESQLKVAAGIIERLSALESTEPQRGPPGRDGTDGRDGKDAVLDRETITQIAQQAAQIVIQQQPQTKPFYIRAREGADYQPVMPGQHVTLIHGKQAQP